MKDTTPQVSLVTDELSSGAEFVRADLHIHSFGSEGSFDMTDATMTPENIVEKALEKGISLISITDHNEIGNVKAALAYSADKPILVIPGIEVTTTQGHLLVYFETYEKLRNFHGKLNIDSNRERCSQGITECLDLAEQYEGIGVLAHIELSSGFEQTINRFGREMEAILKHRNLFGFEIAQKESINRYTDLDEVDARKALMKARRDALDLESDFDLAKIMSSDSHTLTRLGTNAEGQSKLTRIKLDEPTFHSLKIALLCPSSRIRLEDTVPERIPIFKEIRFEGGLLDDQIVKFSPNLTCIIGGRGAGKSTLLQALQEVSGNSGEAPVIDSDVWPQKIEIVYEDETGRQTILQREKNSDVRNISEPTEGILRIPIEGYGQGETAETIQHSDRNPRVLIDFLDRFVDLRGERLADAEVRQQLIENQSELRRLRTEVSLTPETQRTKKDIDEKLRQLKQDKVEDLVNLQIGLIKERELRKSLASDLQRLAKNYEDVLSDTAIIDEFAQIAGEEIIVGREQFESVKKLVADFGTIVKAKSRDLNSELNEKLKDLREQIKNWAEKESDIQRQIDEKKEELAQKEIPFDIGVINALAKDQIHYKNRLNTLKRQAAELATKTTEREELLKNRRTIRNNIYNKRLAFALTVNENLKNTVDDLTVVIKYKQGAYSPDFEERIKSLMQWRTSRVPKAEKLAKHMSPLDFAAAVKTRKLNALNTILDDDHRVFGDDDIRSIQDTVSSNETYEDFETTPFEDLPSISVTKVIEDSSGNRRAITKSLSQLSLGQQQSILLAILLQSKSTAPLVIDQPEDNLDSEFIYKTIVSNLRRIKERRQVIVVTHNANIAVLGDSELIVPLKSTNAKASVVNRGSIDKQATRKLCCEILEGGERAFSKRKEIYGIT